MSSHQSSSDKLSRSVAREDQESGLTDSWVAFNMNTAQNDNRNSAMHEMERMLHEAQRESGASSLVGSTKAGSSPPSTPCNSLSSTPGQSGEASPRNSTNTEPLTEVIPKLLSNPHGDTDWVWDWSSTPSTRPPKNTQFKRPPKTTTLSIRKTSAMKSGYFSWSFLQVFIPSIILTNLVAFGVGIYVGKRLASTSKTMSAI